jgi:hypothetical protein
VLIYCYKLSAVSYQQKDENLQEPGKKHWVEKILRFVKHPFFKWSLWFGVALGCAVACKISAIPVAALLPGAFVIRALVEKWQHDPGLLKQRVVEALVYCVFGAIVSLFVFRVAQPYAFSGPGFFGVVPNPQWVENIKEQRAQSTGDVDFPPALQWARRSFLFSGKNLTVWGLGLPLGLFAWAGFLLAAWRMLKGDWHQHILLWGWTGGYFIWQSMQNNPTMRYQLAVYPGLVIFAGWLAMICLQRKSPWGEEFPGVVSPWVATWKQKSLAVLRYIWMVFKFIIPIAVLVLTVAWAFAFTQFFLYSTDHANRRVSLDLPKRTWTYQFTHSNRRRDGEPDITFSGRSGNLQ